MAKITTTIEISPKIDGYYVVVSLNGEHVSTHGPIPDVATAETVQEEQARIVNAVLRAEVQRIRERLAQIS